jgi:hypothetical protein
MSVATSLDKSPTYPLDRLSRYEATLWRQACQILFTLRYLDRRTSIAIDSFSRAA